MTLGWCGLRATPLWSFRGYLTAAVTNMPEVCHEQGRDCCSPPAGALGPHLGRQLRWVPRLRGRGSFLRTATNRRRASEMWHPTPVRESNVSGPIQLESASSTDQGGGGHLIEQFSEGHHDEVENGRRAVPGSETQPRPSHAGGEPGSLMTKEARLEADRPQLHSSLAGTTPSPQAGTAGEGVLVAAAPPCVP
jgi:hypothetical protein